MKRQYRNPQSSNCQNCGSIDDLEWFEWVLNGVTLCQDCADMPIKSIHKTTANWVYINGEYYPPNFPIANRDP